MYDRREFLKLLGLALGASLSGCGGSSSSSGGTPMPNAYRFVRLARPGQPVGGVGVGGGGSAGRSIMSATLGGEPPFLGGVIINDMRHVCFHAEEDGGRQGVYRIDVEEDGAMTPIEPVLVQGDQLPDGTIVEDVFGGELNNQDDCAFVVRGEDGFKTLQFFRAGEPVRRILSPYQMLTQDIQLQGDLQPMIALSDNGELLFVSDFLDLVDREAEGQGLFYLPGEDVSGTVLLLEKDQLLPGTAGAIRTFGISELRDGEFLVQGSAAPVEDDGTNRPGGMAYLLRGLIGSEPETLVADPSLQLTGPNIIPGSVLMGPRLGSGGLATVVQLDAQRTQLWLNQSMLLEASLDGGATLSPRGSRIVSMFPPVFGPAGLLYVQVFTMAGMELLAYDGSNFTTVLARGDEVDGKILETVFFGALPHCVNSRAELVTVVEFTDGDAGVLLGMPV